MESTVKVGPQRLPFRVGIGNSYYDQAPSAELEGGRFREVANHRDKPPVSQADLPSPDIFFQSLHN